MPPTKKKPIYLSNPNDSRIKSYQDSLYVRTKSPQTFAPGNKTRPLTLNEKKFWKDERTGLVPNLVEYDPRSGHIDQGYFGHFKKPEQPYEYVKDTRDKSNIEPLTPKTPKLSIQEQDNTPVVKQLPVKRTGGKFARYPNMKNKIEKFNNFVSGAKSVKQYRGDENLPEAKKGMKKCGCKHTRSKYKYQEGERDIAADKLEYGDGYETALKNNFGNSPVVNTTVNSVAPVVNPVTVKTKKDTVPIKRNIVTSKKDTIPTKKKTYSRIGGEKKIYVEKSPVNSNRNNSREYSSRVKQYINNSLGELIPQRDTTYSLDENTNKMVMHLPTKSNRMWSKKNIGYGYENLTPEEQKQVQYEQKLRQRNDLAKQVEISNSSLKYRKQYPGQERESAKNSVAPAWKMANNVKAFTKSIEGKSGYKYGTKKLTDPPPDKVYNNTYQSYEGNFNLDPYTYKEGNQAGHLNKFTRKSGKENYPFPEYNPGNLNWTKEVSRVDADGNIIKGTSLHSDLNNPLHVMYHTNGKPNFIYKQKDETEERALKRAEVETFGFMSKKERERYVTQKSQKPYFSEEEENKIIDDYIKRNNYKKENLGYKYGTGALAIPEGSAIVTANGGKNKKALMAYKKGNYKLLNSIIEDMPEDNVNKAQAGKKKLKSSSALEYVPANQHKEKYYGKVTDADFDKLRENNPWYDWSNFDPSKEGDVKKFQGAFNKLSASLGSKAKLEVDDKLGEQTATAKVDYMGEEPIPPPKTIPPPTTTGGDDIGKRKEFVTLPSMAEIAARSSILGQGIEGVPENYLKLGRYNYASQLPKTLQENSLAAQSAMENTRDIVGGDAGRYLAQAGSLSASRMKANNAAVVQDTLARQDILNKNVDLGNKEAEINTGLKNQYNTLKGQARSAYNDQLVALGQRVDSATETAQEMSNQRGADDQRMQILKDLGLNYEYKNVDGLMKLVPKVPTNTPAAATTTTTATTADATGKKGLKRLKTYKRN